MNHQVLFQFLFGIKRFSAMLTREVLLSCVMPQMRIQITTAAKTLATGGTHKRSLPVMHHRVFVQFLFRGKRFGAQGTRMGAFTGMRPHVCRQMPGVYKAFFTNVATVGLLPCVDSYMLG